MSLDIGNINEMSVKNNSSEYSEICEAFLQAAQGIGVYNGHGHIKFNTCDQKQHDKNSTSQPGFDAECIQGGPKITERHISGNNCK